MVSSIENLREVLRTAVDAWNGNGSLLTSSQLSACVREGFVVSARELDLVIESLSAEIVRELGWITRWECDEQGGELNNYPDMALPTFARYEKCAQLLIWAEAHGARGRIADVYKAIEERFPQSAADIVRALDFYRRAT